MTSPSDEWEELRRDWQSQSTTVGTQLRERIVHEHRRIRLARTGAGTLALAAVIGTGLALLHTPSAGDIARALPVIALIAVAWFIERLRWRSMPTVAADATDPYLASSRQRARLQLRAIHLAWVIVAAELAFLVPWWIEGLPYHAGELLSLIAILTTWLPAFLVFAILVWTVRLRRSVRAELKQLEQVASGAE